LRGVTDAHFFYDLKYPGFEWWPTAEPRKITITTRDVAVCAADLLAYQNQERPACVNRNRTHMSNHLTSLIQAAEKFWKNASREERDTHPSNDEVASWLESRGLSASLAEKAASIIRPEWAPTGRKPQK